MTPSWTNEDSFESGQLRICGLCLGSIGKKDYCVPIDGEIVCIPCAVATDIENEPFDDPEVHWVNYEEDDDW